MVTWYYILAALFGLVFGSFANVLILRDKRRLSILTGRSECPHCKHPLAWYDLLPVLSFMWLGGKCRYCKKKISWQYPLVELLSAALAVFSLWYGWFDRGNFWLSVMLFLTLLLFLVIAGIDLIYMEVPLDYVVVIGVLGGLSMLLSHELSWLSVGLGILSGAVAVAIVLYGWRLLFKQDGMGVGDIWIAGAIGALVGYPQVFVALMLGVFSGALVGILFLIQSRNNLKKAIPFGPFLYLGLILTLVWGVAILKWYML